MGSIGDVFGLLAGGNCVRKLSDSNSQPTVMVKMAAAAYGGTDRSWAVVDL